MATCTKITYPTVWHANQALQIIALKGSTDGDKLPASVYPCRECKAWHLTSQKAGGRATKWLLRRL